MSGAQAQEPRIELLDLLRGVALLGILVINVRFFALPLLRWNDPFTSIESVGPAELCAWLLGQVLFEHEMIALFSMLFGAGLILGEARLERQGRSATALHYRRMFWLLGIGVLHALLLWYGDILMAYALCGALVFPLRRLTPRLLLVLGALVLSIAPLIRAMPAADPAEGVGRAGLEAQSPAPVSIAQRWQVLAHEEAAARGGGLISFLRWRARVDVLWHVHGFPRFTLWLAAGFMLLGMGLLRAGVLDGLRASAFYGRLAVFGYGLGLPAVLAGVHPQIFDALLEANRVAPGSVQAFAALTFPSPLPAVLHHPLRYGGGALVALGHLGLIVLLYRTGVGAGLVRALSAVGRMTLSAYLTQSLICALCFDVWALGLWSRLGHAPQLGFVAGVWAIELLLCPLWLRHFRLGPVEWLWRSLTHGARQPMRAPATAA